MTDALHRIICLGDSLTLGVGTAELDKWPTQLALGLEKWRPGAFSLYNRGFNGATTVGGLDRIDPELSYLLPATVLVAFGANDCSVVRHRRTPNIGLEEFKTNLAEMARYVEDKGGRVIYIAVHIPDPDRRPEDKRTYIPGNGRTYAENYLPYRNAIREVAAALKRPVIDIAAEVEARGLATSDLVVADGIHLSPAGNAIYAEIILKALKHEI